MTERRFTVYSRDIDTSALEIDWSDWIIVTSHNQVKQFKIVGTVRPSLPYQGIARRALGK